MRWTPTRSEVVAEIEEKTLDLRAFYEAREIIRRRVLEVKDSRSKLTPLVGWAGTDCVLGGLDLTIHAMERTLEELHAMLKTMPAGLKIIDGGKDGPVPES
jgi:hypothetical protein